MKQQMQTREGPQHRVTVGCRHFPATPVPTLLLRTEEEEGGQHRATAVCRHFEAHRRLMLLVDVGVVVVDVDVGGCRLCVFCASCFSPAQTVRDRQQSETRSPKHTRTKNNNHNNTSQTTPAHVQRQHQQQPQPNNNNSETRKQQICDTMRHND